MEYKCNICNRNFNSEESFEQHNVDKHPKEEKKKINFRKYSVFLIIALIIIFSVLTINSYAKKPGKYDDFAKCLTEKGAVIYGNDFCSYTRNQMGFFGKSKKYLSYVKCIDNKELCDSKGVEVTPTWEINGEMYPQVQTFEKLTLLSGCEI